MADRTELLTHDFGVDITAGKGTTITLAWYEEPAWGILHLGTGRFSINLWKLSLIIECWWYRRRSL